MSPKTARRAVDLSCLMPASVQIVDQNSLTNWLPIEPILTACLGRV